MISLIWHIVPRFVAVTVIFVSIHSEARANERLTLVVGHSKIVQVTGAASVAVGDPSVVDVKVLPGGNEVMLTGVQRGVTNIILLMKDGRRKHYSVQVFASDPRAIAGAIEEALAGVEGVKVRVAGERVILEGEVLKKEDEELISHIISAFPGVVSFVRKKRVLPALMVQIDVKLIEVSESSLKDVGFAFPSFLGAESSLKVTGKLDSVFSNLLEFSIVNKLSASLRLLWQAGAVRVLSNPVLITRSGEKARFLAGGEIPVPTAGSLGQMDVEYKEFGVLLEFTPRADVFGYVDLDVHVSVSDLDFSKAVENSGFRIPAIYKRETSTRVNIREGESLALAEIFNESWRKNVSKLPFLGHIPILGELFKSRQFQNGRSKFMVFVTPRVIKPGRLPVERIKRMLEEYELWRRKVGANLFD